MGRGEIAAVVIVKRLKLLIGIRGVMKAKKSQDETRNIKDQIYAVKRPSFNIFVHFCHNLNKLKCSFFPSFSLFRPKDNASTKHSLQYKIWHFLVTTDSM